MKFRRTVIPFLVSAVVASTTCLVANAEVSKVGPSGQLTIWTWYPQWTQAYVKLFNKTYPNIHVHVVSYSHQNYNTKLQSSIAGGAGVPDVVEIDNSDIGQYLNSGEFVDMLKPPYSVNRNLWYKNLVGEFTDSKGELIGLPESANPGGIWYNRELVKKYLGTDDPVKVAKLIGSGKSGYSKFITAMNIIVKKSAGKVKALPGLADMFNMMQYQKGTNLVNGNKFVFPSVYKEDFNVLQQITNDNLTADLDANNDQQAYINGINSNKIAFLPGACWILGYIIPIDKQTQGKWGFIPSPGGNWSQGDQISAIWKNDPNKNIAWIWAKWFNENKRAQLLQWQLGTTPPSLIAAFKSPEIQKVNPTTHENMGKIFASIMKTAASNRYSPYDASIDTIVGQQLPLMEQHKLTAAQALQQIEQQVRLSIHDLQ